MGKQILKQILRFSRNRLLVFRVLLSLLFLGLLSRFFYVQIIEGDKYLRVSESNRVKQVTIAAPRGLIYDRYGELLVDNLPAYSLYALPSELAARDSVFALLGKLLQKPAADLAKVYRKERRGPFQRVKLAKYISFPQLARVEERKIDLPGIEFDIEPRRFYPSGVLAPHLFGYLGEISEVELQEMAAYGYRRGDIVGKKGIEKVFERELRGQKGLRYVEVDALGREVRVLENLPGRPPKPGKDVYLTIDAKLQRYLENVMHDQRGGAAVLNCKNGEVLALVSKPDYDPEIFAKPIARENWQELINNPDHPLFDRMVQSQYPPGSTYKIILAIAGLETGKINPRETVFCPGYLQLGRRRFWCWRHGGHGKVNLLSAIEQSCNVYFYKMIQKVGLDPWVEYSRKFHFGERTGIELTGERPGLVPDSAYFNARYGKHKWSLGQLLNLSVGQGDLLVTPLQMATFAMALANKGVSFRPRIHRKIVDRSEHTEVYSVPDTIYIRGISDRTWELIHEGMYRVVNGVNGTAHLADPGLITVAGKSGTAQNPHGEAHAWFIGFAPFDDPQVAFVFFIENGGSGGAHAAPIARGMLQLLIRDKKIRL